MRSFEKFLITIKIETRFYEKIRIGGIKEFLRIRRSRYSMGIGQLSGQKFTKA